MPHAGPVPLQVLTKCQTSAKAAEGNGAGIQICAHREKDRERDPEREGGGRKAGREGRRKGGKESERE